MTLQKFILLGFLFEVAALVFLIIDVLWVYNDAMTGTKWENVGFETPKYKQFLRIKQTLKLGSIAFLLLAILFQILALALY